MLQVKETYVNRDTNIRFGETDWYETWTDDRGKLFRSLRSEFGRCTGKMYADTATETLTDQGWIFLKRTPYGGNSLRSDAKDTYLQETWIQVREVPS